MPLLINLRRLGDEEVRFEGEIPLEELDLGVRDEMVQPAGPVTHDLEVQQMDDSLLVQGSLSLPLACQCVRCLKPFNQTLTLDPWTALLPLEGEEKVPVEHDCVDLTPWVREDILLEFPQHPLCGPDCPGLTGSTPPKGPKPGRAKANPAQGSTWAELNKLKF